MNEFYGSAEDNGDLPDNLNFAMTDAQFEQARFILTVLEMVEYKWTITQVLEQPRALLERIMSMRMIGNKIKIQRNQNG